MANQLSDKYEDAMIEAMEEHSSSIPFVLLVALALAWVLLITEVIPTKNIDEAFASLDFSPTTLLFIIGLVHIYFFAKWINRRLFKKKFIEAAQRKGLSKTKIEIYDLKRTIEHTIFDGDLHGNMQKKISKLRQGK